MKLKNLAIESSLNATAFSDLETHITYVNQAFLTMLGYESQEEVLGKTPFEFVPDEWQARISEVLETVFSQGKFSGDIRAVKKDGAFIDVSVLVNLVNNEQGEPVRILVSFVDITERKQAENRIKTALQEKEALLREIHHRVKNNMMVVTSLIQMQAEQTSDPDALTLFRDLYNRVLSMAMVHEDLYQSHNLAQIDFGAYLQRLVINIRQGFSRADVAFKIAAEDIFLDIHHAIPCGLIVVELLTNAFKYAFPPSPPAPLPKGEGNTLSPLAREGEGEGETLPSPFGRGAGGEGSVIRVEMRYEEPTYTLIVNDNGVGLPPEFDMQKSRTLGLTLVRSWVVHQLKGKIEVDTQQGTGFTIVFQ